MDEANSGILKFATRVTESALYVLMLGITALVFVQVILRYVLRAPLMGIEELLLFPTVWLYMLGGVNASSQRTQIVCRVLEIFFKTRRPIAVIRLAGSVISVIVAAWLTYWAYDYLLYALRVPRVSATLYIPLIYAESAVFICMVLITFYTGLEARYYGVLMGRPEEELKKVIQTEKD